MIFSLIPEKLKICSIHREQLREFNSFPHEEIEGWISNLENLEEEKRKMFHEMQAEIRTLKMM